MCRVHLFLCCHSLLRFSFPYDPLPLSSLFSFCSFFFNDTATTEIYTLSLHDALPISARRSQRPLCPVRIERSRNVPASRRSEEHTSELQSLTNLVCRLLLEKKKKKTTIARLYYARQRQDRDATS